ncbi:MAG: hypothetical protein DHS20C01_14100 [marine bacterium B5-7]|nr:MAG: hypothetical protein DHS20C01_14100 [marine bacterium B5-7]
MASRSTESKLQFSQIYRMPGEGLIAEFRQGHETMLFDIEGLQFRVLKRRSAGMDTSEEDKALAMLSNLGG